MIRDPSDGSVKPNSATDKPNSVSIDTAKHGKNYGLQTIPERPKSNFKAPTPEELKQHYAKFKLAFEPKEET